MSRGPLRGSPTAGSWAAAAVVWKQFQPVKALMMVEKKKIIVLGVTSSRLYHHPKLNLTPATNGVTFEAIVFPALLSMTCPRGCYYMIIQGFSFFLHLQ